MRWDVAIYRQGVEKALPCKPGIYVLAKVCRTRGFPTQAEAVYVGQSRDLRRRIIQHLHRLEPNPLLNGAHWPGELEVWWRVVPVDQLDHEERELIEQLRPDANRKGKKKSRQPA